MGECVFVVDRRCENARRGVWMVWLATRMRVADQAGGVRLHSVAARPKHVIAAHGPAPDRVRSATLGANESARAFGTCYSLGSLPDGLKVLEFDACCAMVHPLACSITHVSVVLMRMAATCTQQLVAGGMQAAVQWTCPLRSIVIVI